jgi:hypothetical protein
MAGGRQSYVLIPILCAAGCVLAGCRTAPETLGAADLRGADAPADTASEYWKQEGAPPMGEAGSRRVAIVEFSVEYVTVKHESPFQSQFMAGAPPVTPVTAGLAVSGLQRRQVSFGESLCAELPDELYAMFVAQLVERGFFVLSPERVCGSRAYQRFETAAMDDGSFLQRLNYVSSDTGSIKKMVAYPASGYRLVGEANDGDAEEVELALLDEVGADLALRVRVRVGVYRGHATVERGTVVNVLSRDATGSLNAERSLLSDVEVIDDKRFKAVKGQTVTVDALSYRSAMRRVFPPYMALGYEAGQLPAK